MNAHWMKAVIYRQYGGIEVLETEILEKPEINDNQLLVAVHASSVNPIDWKVRRGDIKIVSGSNFPNRLGCDFAGKVAALGKNISGYKIGDGVYGTIDPVKGGAYAEYLSVDPDNVAIKPANMSFEEAATVPTVGLTALQGLTKKAKIQPDDQVLINGCSGGVGIMAIQVAKIYGAAVTGVCSEKGFAISRKMGADHLINYQDEELLETEQRFDIFFDVVANQNFIKAKKLLKKHGTFVTTEPSPKTFIQSEVDSLLSSKKFKFIVVRPYTEDLNTLRELIERGKLTTVIDKTFSLEEIKAAHAYGETMRTKGKIAISINSQV